MTIENIVSCEKLILINRKTDNKVLLDNKVLFQTFCNKGSYRQRTQQQT